MTDNSRRVWLAVILVVLAAALVVRWLTFERFLPYADYADEINMYLLGRDWLGLEHDPVVPDWLAGYPPLYVWVSMGIQVAVNNLVQKPWLFIGDYLYYARLVAVLVGVATTLVVAITGWQMAGALAGFLAGMVWALSPIIVEHNSLAIPDPLVYLGCALAISFALRAWHNSSPRWAILSVLAGIVTVYLKYPGIYALIPGIVVSGTLFVRQPRRWLRPVIVQSVLLALAAAYLIWGYGALRLSNREAETVQSEGLAFMLDIERNLNNGWFAVYPVGEMLFWPVVLAGIGLVLLGQRRGWRTVQPFTILLLLVYAIISIMVSAAFSLVNFPAGKIRHTLPATVALIPLWAAAFVQIVWWLQDRLIKREGLRRWIPVVLVGGLAAVFIMPALAEITHMARQYRQTDIRQVLWEWSDANLPPEGMILMHPHSYIENTWNRNWSGYDGSTPFEWWFEEALPENTPAEYVERGITYFAVSESDWATVYANRAGVVREFVDRLTLVKEIVPGEDVYGETVQIYRMYPPQRILDGVVFGEQIALVGYDINAAQFSPGDEVVFRPYWRIAQGPITNYSMFIHVYPPERDEQIAQYDGPPASPQRPTLLWTDRGELYIGQQSSLTLPDSLEAGTYRLAVGLYDFTTGQRLALPSGETFYTLEIEIG